MNICRILAKYSGKKCWLTLIHIDCNSPISDVDVNISDGDRYRGAKHLVRRSGLYCVFLDYITLFRIGGLGQIAPGEKNECACQGGGVGGSLR
jgi:hypothetical protein